MRSQRLVILGLILALFALLAPFGVYVMRLGGRYSLLWVFGVWALLVLIAGISSRRSRKDQDGNGA